MSTTTTSGYIVEETTGLSTGSDVFGVFEVGVNGTAAYSAIAEALVDAGIKNMFYHQSSTSK